MGDEGANLASLSEEALDEKVEGLRERALKCENFAGARYVGSIGQSIHDARRFYSSDDPKRKDTVETLCRQLDVFFQDPSTEIPTEDRDRLERYYTQKQANSPGMSATSPPQLFPIPSALGPSPVGTLEEVRQAVNTAAFASIGGDASAALVTALPDDLAEQLADALEDEDDVKSLSSFEDEVPQGCPQPIEERAEGDDVAPNVAAPPPQQQRWATSSNTHSNSNTDSGVPEVQAAEVASAEGGDAGGNGGGLQGPPGVPGESRVFNMPVAQGQAAGSEPPGVAAVEDDMEEIVMPAQLPGSVPTEGGAGGAEGAKRLPSDNITSGGGGGGGPGRVSSREKRQPEERQVVSAGSRKTSSRGAVFGNQAAPPANKEDKGCCVVM